MHHSQWGNPRVDFAHPIESLSEECQGDTTPNVHLDMHDPTTMAEPSFPWLFCGAVSEPVQFRSKEISKSNVVDDMVESNKILYEPGEHPDHVVVIK